MDDEIGGGLILISVLNFGLLHDRGLGSILTGGKNMVWLREYWVVKFGIFYLDSSVMYRDRKLGVY